jgi:putative transposase
MLDVQSTEQIGAERYERNQDRRADHNSIRERQMTTRIGTITLEIHRHRQRHFQTDLFERYQRSQQDLIMAMIEMVINGVSNRKIQAVNEELWVNLFLNQQCQFFVKDWIKSSMHSKITHF